MQLIDFTLSAKVLYKIKCCLEGLSLKNPDFLVAELVRPADVCALDLVELRMFFEEKLGIDFDLITIRQVLENWDAVFLT